VISAALASFLFFCVIFSPLERMFPMHRRPLLRKRLATDLAFLFGNFLIWTPLIVVALWSLRTILLAIPLDFVRVIFSCQPLCVQAIEAILLSDLAIYWFHRWCHRSSWLWRMHRIHHQADSLDWIAAYREHPLDNLLTRAVENAPLFALGLPVSAIAGIATFRGLWSLFIHANVDLSPGPLKYLLGAPRLHHWHHASGHDQRVNFGNLNPLFDLLFGTFHDPGHDPHVYGVGEADAGYVTMLLSPVMKNPPDISARGIVIQAPPRLERG
jgi:sterol desaturase/sphingolipid hydroxylase (fatty acid hydroxylase superfamily)